MFIDDTAPMSISVCARARVQPTDLADAADLADRQRPDESQQLVAVRPHVVLPVRLVHVCRDLRDEAHSCDPAARCQPTSLLPYSPPDLRREFLRAEPAPCAALCHIEVRLGTRRQ